MGNCSGWHDSLDWQNTMFTYIDRGFSIKNAFLLASSLYPKLSDCVKFVGDEKIKIKALIKGAFDIDNNLSSLAILLHNNKLIS